jgi:hypothetical protein
MEFIYFSDEWNQEEIRGSSTNPSGVVRGTKDADTDPEQKEVHEKK